MVTLTTDTVLLTSLCLSAVHYVYCYVNLVLLLAYYVAVAVVDQRD